MSLEDLGNLGEFIASVGVFVTLVYLALQIRQNTHATRSSITLEAMRDQVSVMSQLNTDGELNRIFFKGLQDSASLSGEEQRRFTTYMVTVLRTWENALYQIEHGALDRAVWAGLREQGRFVLSQPGAVVWWKRSANLFNPELQEFVERELL